jgi:hypothetical protein
MRGLTLRAFQNLEQTEWEGFEWNNVVWDRRKVAGCCVHGNEHSVSVKFGECLLTQELRPLQKNITFHGPGQLLG